MKFKPDQAKADKVFAEIQSRGNARGKLVSPKAIVVEIRLRIAVLADSINSGRHQKREATCLRTGLRMLEVLANDIVRDLQEAESDRLSRVMGESDASR